MTRGTTIAETHEGYLVDIVSGGPSASVALRVPSYAIGLISYGTVTLKCASSGNIEYSIHKNVRYVAY